MPMAFTGSRVKVRGMRIATPMVEVSPGREPNTSPRKVPATTKKRV